MLTHRLPKNRTHAETTRMSANRTDTELISVWMVAVGIHANSCLL